MLIETSNSYGRGLLLGVRRYLGERGPWSVFLELRAPGSAPPRWLRAWRGDGVLTATATRGIADAVRSLGLPTVELRSPHLNPHAPSVGCDNPAIGRLAANHLIDRGFRHFAACQLGTESGLQQRRVGFGETVRRAGYDCTTYPGECRPRRPTQWERQQDDLAAWAKRLPKPVGLMACTDQAGFYLLDACARARVAVPDEIAVIGVGNDESLCTMATPALTSVKLNAERIGYEAAALLDRLMAGEAAPNRPVLIEPLGVITRRSSDLVATDDPEIARAVQFIRQAACDGISVGDIVQEVAISRSALERRMRAALGRSPNEEITRVRIQRAKELLISTAEPLKAIAWRTGFQTPQYLVQVFRQQVGMTPGAFRRENSFLR
ncbi:MAG: XylR family transcriptional regulator [Pirellulaceae bacterium]|jgi:LacI family transcriptional regulator|nr:XylR family transcriptional regulator [Pirellulaceae bacterium]